MPWKQGYTISDKRSLTDSELRWPSCAGIRACGTRRRLNARATGWKPIPPARICVSRRAFGRTTPAASAKGGRRALVRGKIILWYWK